MKTITMDGQKYVLVPVEEWDIISTGKASMPPLPKADAQGNLPALAFARASIARGIIRDRTAAKLSQAELARRAKIAVETLNRIEKAKVTADEATLTKIDKAFKTTLLPKRAS